MFPIKESYTNNWSQQFRIRISERIVTRMLVSQPITVSITFGKGG